MAYRRYSYDSFELIAHGINEGELIISSASMVGVLAVSGLG
jgi:hypothetical protein